MRWLLAFSLLSISVGCAHEPTPVEAGLRTAEEAKTLNNRASPLREEVDEIAPVRDQVLKNSGEAGH